MIDGRLLVVARLVINDTEVDMGEELSGDISHLLVPRVVVNGVAIERWVALTQLHVIDTNAVVRKCFSMHITDSLAHLKELLVRLNGELELAEIIVENAGRVVSTSLISRLASPAARESQDIVVFKPLLGGNSIVRVCVAHL